MSVVFKNNEEKKYEKKIEPPLWNILDFDLKVHYYPFLLMTYLVFV